MFRVLGFTGSGIWGSGVRFGDFMGVEARGF